MKIIISPAKSQDFTTLDNTPKSTTPIFLEKSELLLEELRKLSIKDISNLMSVSDNIAKMNFERFKKWNINYKNVESGAALFSFTGAVYESLSAKSLKTKELSFANKTLRILSGLYGILKPSDLIMPYRLEMACPLKSKEFKNLYNFWKEELTQSIIKEIKKDKDKVLINLASIEYSKAIDFKKLPVPIITPIFKENKNGKLKTVAIFAKKARGAMTRFILENQLKDSEMLKTFNWANFKFDSINDKNGEWLFLR